MWKICDNAKICEEDRYYDFKPTDFLQLNIYMLGGCFIYDVIEYRWLLLVPDRESRWMSI